MTVAVKGWAEQPWRSALLTSLIAIVAVTWLFVPLRGVAFMAITIVAAALPPLLILHGKPRWAFVIMSPLILFVPGVIGAELVAHLFGICLQ